jgi:hypothetical protein
MAKLSRPLTPGSSNGFVPAQLSQQIATGLSVGPASIAICNYNIAICNNPQVDFEIYFSIYGERAICAASGGQDLPKGCRKWVRSNCHSPLLYHQKWPWCACLALTPGCWIA